MLWSDGVPNQKASKEKEQIMETLINLLFFFDQFRVFIGHF